MVMVRVPIAFSLRLISVHVLHLVLTFPIMHMYGWAVVQAATFHVFISTSSVRGPVTLGFHSHATSDVKEGEFLHDSSDGDRGQTSS